MPIDRTDEEGNKREMPRDDAGQRRDDKREERRPDADAAKPMDMPTTLPPD